MHKNVKNRLIKLGLIFLSVLLGVYLIISNLNENIIFFYPPSELNKIDNSKIKIRVGGLVQENSVQIIDNKKVIFTLTDQKASILVEYNGLLPALFRENQGIVAEGKLIDGKLLQAERLLTKHDENYYPPGKEQ